MNGRLDLAPSKTPPKPKSITTIVAILGFIISLTAGLFIAGVANNAQVLIIAAGITAFIVIFTRLELGAVLTIVVLYTQAYIIVGERYGVTDVVQALIMLMALSMGTRWIVYSHEIPRGWMRPLLLVAFYCLIGLASVLYAVDSAVALRVSIETAKAAIIALIIAILLTTEKSFRLTVWALLFVGIFLGSLSVIQVVTGSYDNDFGGYARTSVQNIAGRTNDYRLGGPMGDPNYYAQMMLVLVPLALDRLWNEKRGILRLLAAWALSVCVFSVLLTYSRGGFFAMLGTIFAMFAFFHRGQLRSLLVIGVIGLMVIYFVPSRFSERMRTLTELFPSSENSTTLRDVSLRGRTSEMIVALQMFADHPILGVGLGNYPILYQKYAQPLGLEMRSEDRQAHSLYLEVLSESGLLGFFSFGLLLWFMLKSMWQAKQNLAKNGLISTSNIVAAYTLGFIGYLLAASFIHAAYARNFWVLAGIALSIPRMAEIEIAAAESIKHRLFQKRPPTLPRQP